MSETELVQQSLSDLVYEAYSPISPSADRNLIKPLGDCCEEFRLSVSHEGSNVLWDLSEFAKAGKLLKTPAMDVDFYDEYEMRKVYSLIYDVFRCKYVVKTVVTLIVVMSKDDAFSLIDLTTLYVTLG